MALGGSGYFHAGYFSQQYWHTDYWIEQSAVSALIHCIGRHLVALKRNIIK